MNNSRVDFNLLDRGNHDPVGYKEITCYLIFDVKMDFTRKARDVTVRHIADSPLYITFAGVLCSDSVRLAFIISLLYDLDILSGDIQHVYLNAPTKEKVFFSAGDK